jgi:hypothetical protein
MPGVGLALLISTVAGALVAFLTGLVTRFALHPTERGTLLRLIVSATFLFATAVIVVLALHSRQEAAGLCLTCGRRAPIVTVCGWTIETGPPARHSTGPDYESVFSDVLDSHRHRWSATEPCSKWFWVMPLVSDREAARSWVLKMCSWPEEVRRLAFVTFDAPCRPRGFASPDVEFESWRKFWTSEFPERQ